MRNLFEVFFSSERASAEMCRAAAAHRSNSKLVALRQLSDGNGFITGGGDLGFHFSLSSAATSFGSGQCQTQPWGAEGGVDVLRSPIQERVDGRRYQCGDSTSEFQLMIIHQFRIGDDQSWQLKRARGGERRRKGRCEARSSSVNQTPRGAENRFRDDSPAKPSPP